MTDNKNQLSRFAKKGMEIENEALMLLNQKRIKFYFKGFSKKFFFLDKRTLDYDGESIIFYSDVNGKKYIKKVKSVMCLVKVKT